MEMGYLIQARLTRKVCNIGYDLIDPKVLKNPDLDPVNKKCLWKVVRQFKGFDVALVNGWGNQYNLENEDRVAARAPLFKPEILADCTSNCKSDEISCHDECQK
jgi:hypothetical protein